MTFGELENEMGTQELLTAVVARNIALRSVLAELIDAVRYDYRPHGSRGKRTMLALRDAEHELNVVPHRSSDPLPQPGEPSMNLLVDPRTGRP